MASRLSIFHPPGRMGYGANPFGKDVANLQLWRALAQHGGFEQLDVLSHAPTREPELRQALLDDAPAALRLTADNILNQAVPAAAGALLRGQPYLHELAWLRRRGGGDRAYSLLGLVHTLAPPAIREMIGMTLTSPVQPWDAVICTSPSVRDALARMFDEYGDFLGERTHGVRPPQPQLPVVPLGVEGEVFAARADRPEARARLRAELGLAEDDVLVLWVGRLSFYEKAFPQPMFAAVQQAQRATGAKVAFVMAGWFPAEADRESYAQAARVHAPDIDVRLVDGNDAGRVADLWAASDVFLSLVDNIQETFGLTPLEAMAAGRPVVVSDWDGYRYTVRDGIEGFLIPTLIGSPGGLSATIAQNHVLEATSYQVYVGALAQHTAVHVGRAAEALSRLIADPELRRRMGAAGRARVREAFDWKVVARQYNSLVDDLAARRAAAADPASNHRTHPVKGDPFRDFAGFATAALRLDTPLTAAPGASAERVLRAAQQPLDVAFPSLRATVAECAQAFEQIASGQARTARDVLMAAPPERRRPMELGLLWLAKYGFIDWPT
ncbi:glycosyltransferase family 4 protein [Phenylobacterium sp. LjRoot219]|uniref:glycosyltransferase family 4 protein n=1 Tax=Phenylobacterium sp. LjRoot219 TaxID=3342283 RepID=UPI003ECCB465